MACPVAGYFPDVQPGFPRGRLQFGEGASPRGLGVGEDEFRVHPLQSLHDSNHVLSRDTSKDADEVASRVAFRDCLGEASGAVAVVRGIQNHGGLLPECFEACAEPRHPESLLPWRHSKQFHCLPCALEVFVEIRSGVAWEPVRSGGAIGTEYFGAQLCRAVQGSILCRRGWRPCQDEWSPRTENPRLLKGNLPYVASQQRSMVVAEGGDYGQRLLFGVVRGVQPSADACLQDRVFDFLLAEELQRQDCEYFEEGRMKACLAEFFAERDCDAFQFIVCRKLPVDLEAFPDCVEMRAGEDAAFVAGGGDEGAREIRRGTLALGSCNVDEPHAALGVAGEGSQRIEPVEGVVRGVVLPPHVPLQVKVFLEDAEERAFALCVQVLKHGNKKDARMQPRSRASSEYDSSSAIFQPSALQSPPRAFPASRGWRQACQPMACTR